MTRNNATAAKNQVDQGLMKRLASRLRAAGVVYASLFGSPARGEARPDSDADVAVSFGKAMNVKQYMAVIGIVVDETKRSVDVVDLETAKGLVLPRALGGREILCYSVATRQRMADRLRRTEDDRIVAAKAALIARARLFTTRSRRR